MLGQALDNVLDHLSFFNPFPSDAPAFHGFSFPPPIFLLNEMCSAILAILSGRQSDLLLPHVEFSASVWKVYLPVINLNHLITVSVPTLNLQPHSEPLLLILILPSFYFWTASAVEL